MYAIRSYYACERLKLRRETATVMTEFGEARIKRLYDGDELLRITPEYESCRQLAEQSGRPLADVYRLVPLSPERWYSSRMRDSRNTS